MKIIFNYLQSRSAVKVIFSLLEKHKSISGIDLVDSKLLAKKIIRDEIVSLPEVIGDGKFPRHLVHHFTIVAHCVCNIIVRVTENHNHPAQKELFSMYMCILDDLMTVILHPSADEHFNFTPSDYEIIDSVIHRANNVEIAR